MVAPIGMVAGLVQDTSNLSVAGAHVCLTGSVHGCAQKPECTVADEAGKFELVPGCASFDTIVASAPGHLSTTQPLFFASSESHRASVVLRLSPGGANVSGTAVDVSGGVVPGARLTLLPRVGGGAPAFGVTDSLGRFELSAASGPVRLSAEAEAYAPAEIDLDAPAAEVALLLSASSTISGRVVALDSRAAVADAMVTATNVDGLRAPMRQTRSQPDGSFRLQGLSAGRHELVAVARSWRSTPQSVSVGAGLAREDVTIVASPASSLTGSVRIADGPCPSAMVQLLGPSTLTVSGNPDGELEAHGILPGRYQVDVVCSEQTHTPLSEVIEVGHVPIERIWELTPEVAGLAGTETAPPGCCSGTGRIRVRLSSGSSHVLTPRLRIADQRARHTSVQGRPEGDSFVFENLRVGLYEVYLERAPETGREVSLRREGQEVELSLDVPVLAAIAGRVLDADGLPVPDAWVRATREEYGLLESLPALTDADGAFVLEGLFAGTYEVSAESAVGNAVRSSITAGAEGIVLRVSEYGSIAGTVVNAEGASEPFTLAYRRSTTSEVKFVAGVGRWSLPWLATGTYEFAAVTESGVAVAAVTIVPGPPVELQLSVGPYESSPDWVQRVPHRGVSVGARKNRTGE